MKIGMALVLALLAWMATIACGGKLARGGAGEFGAGGLGAAGGSGRSSGRLADELAVYNFAVEARPVWKQADLLERLGFSGVTFIHSSLPDITAEYLAHPAVAARRFRIVAVFFDVDAAKPDLSAMKKAFLSIARAQAIPWITVSNSAPVVRGQVVAAVRQAADVAAALRGGDGVTLVLYPHAGNHMDSAEIALEIIQEAQRSNVMLSLHLCHELKAGNQYRLQEVIERTAPYIALATINGADTEREVLLHDYTHTIMPLAEGDLDVEHLFLRPLLDSGYDGPILLHTFGLTQAPESHLKESRLRWKEMVMAWSRSR